MMGLVSPKKDLNIEIMKNATEGHRPSRRKDVKIERRKIEILFIINY